MEKIERNMKQFTAMHTYYNALATRLDFYLKF